ncbi:acyltransferase [Candidatus Borrarchaeum sp.]|uniref:acyltransferase n=1 Tax=Candidatus Borrarchaeum sp. TaxID=2846742 RepID=UPI00258014E9|nr:acyltransferase [Candidatus Borrarchaeum sp.]
MLMKNEIKQIQTIEEKALSDDSSKGMKRIQLGYQTPTSFKDSLKQAASEHGYRGWLGNIRFGLRFLHNHILLILTRFIPYTGINVLLHRKRGVRIGKQVYIDSDVFIDEIFPYFVKIEDEVTISTKTIILAHSKPNIFHKDHLESFAAPVTIKRGAFIGVGAIILPGVEVGEGSVIGAGAVVNKNVPSYTFVAGVPAKEIKTFKP